MKDFITYKTLIKCNLGIPLFFIALYLIDLYKINSIFLGVFREIATIPLLVLQYFFLFLSIRYVFKNNAKNFWLNISIFILAIGVTVTTCSFCNFNL